MLALIVWRISGRKHRSFWNFAKDFLTVLRGSAVIVL
jgi:hypothetical protein